MESRVGVIQLEMLSLRHRYYAASQPFAGNRMSQITDLLMSRVWTNTLWNVRNQLTGISATSFAALFAYDSFGRRTGKTVQGATTNFVYDGLNPLQEKNGATVTANLLTGLGIDEFFTRTDGGGVRALLPDALGSTVAEQWHWLWKRVARVIRERL